MKTKHWTVVVPGTLIAFATSASALDLQQAVQTALTTNPQIRQAVANRIATQEERIQGQGLYYPHVSVEASGGVRNLQNPTRRNLGIADKTMYPLEGDLIVDQVIFDSGGRAAEVRKQAGRTDAAAARVEERSEFIALNVSRAYIDYLLQQRLVAIAQDNATFHERLSADLREGVSKGSISIADQQQAEERMQAARAKVTSAKEDLDTAGISFQTLTGIPIDNVSIPPDLSHCMPATLTDAEATARENNPLVREAYADLASAREDVSKAKADLGPTFSLEARGRAGHDIDGFEGKTTDLQALGVLRWLIFNGGTKEANVREQHARADEAHSRLFEQSRAAAEDARSAWSRLTNQTALAAELEQQGRISDDVLLSYREQFNIGRRSLLDVLDAQNTRNNVQAQTETARLAKLYAQYRVLAATNRLIECLNVQAPAAARADQMQQFKVQSVSHTDLDEMSYPLPTMGPPASAAPQAAPTEPPAPPAGR